MSTRCRGRSVRSNVIGNSPCRFSELPGTARTEEKTPSEVRSSAGGLDGGGLVKLALMDRQPIAQKGLIHPAHTLETDWTNVRFRPGLGLEIHVELIGRRTQRGDRHGHLRHRIAVLPQRRQDAPLRGQHIGCHRRLARS